MIAPEHEHGPVVLICANCQEAIEFHSGALDRVLDQLGLAKKVTATVTSREGIG